MGLTDKCAVEVHLPVCGQAWQLLVTASDGCIAGPITEIHVGEAGAALSPIWWSAGLPGGHCAQRLGEREDVGDGLLRVS